MSIRKKFKYFDIRDWFFAILKWRRWGFLDICPTWKCNAKCPTCNSWKRDRGELSKDQATQLVNHKYFKHINTVIIEGGEPTLWTHLEYFVELFLNKHPYANINIITNGFKSNFIYDFCVHFLSKKDRIKFYVSLNGDEEIHDKSRGVKDAYKRTMTSAQIISNLGYFLQFSSVTFDQNIDKADHVFEMAEKFGCNANFCWSTDYARFENDGSWTTKRKDDIRAVMEKASSKLRWLDRWCYDYFLEKANNKEILPCFAGYRYVHVNPQGVLRPCLFDETMVMGQIYPQGVSLFECGKVLKRIPNECQYYNGQLCDDCLTRKSTRASIFKVLWWKLWSR